MAVRMVFVCTGNVARSPYAEWVTRAWGHRLGVQVDVASCGTAAQPGSGFDPEMAVRLPGWATEDPGTFRSQQVSATVLAGVDLVLTAERHHQEWVLDHGTTAVTLTLGQYARAIAEAPSELVGEELLAAVRRRRPAPRAADNVLDPHRRGPAAAARAAAHLDELLAAVLPRTFGWDPAAIIRPT